MPVRRCPYTSCNFKTEDVNDNLAAILLQIHASDSHFKIPPEFPNGCYSYEKEESDSRSTTKHPAGKLLMERKIPVAAEIVLMEGEGVEIEAENFSDDSFDLEDIAPLDSYSMNHKYRGNFLIFNHERFSNGHSERKGTNWDEFALYKAARKLGFKSPQTFPNFTMKQVEDKLEEISQQRFEDDDCLVCCYLTHGNNRGQISTKDHQMEVCHLWNSFTSDKCPGLAGKPKIFIIQACRGIEEEKFVRKDEDERDQVDSEDEDDAAYFQEGAGIEGFYLPDDVILAYATIPGFISWRNSKQGSYFIQALCNVIKEQPYLEINQMLIRVNSELIETLRRRKNGKRAQVACFQSTLTKRLNFQPAPNQR